MSEKGNKKAMSSFDITSGKDNIKNSKKNKYDKEPLLP